MNQHRATPEQVLERIESAFIRERYKCAACRWRAQEIGGEGTCATKMRYIEGGKCGFSYDPEGEI